jgi:hypothetical protein
MRVGLGIAEVRSGIRKGRAAKRPHSKFMAEKAKI